jgi:hypothetical protein
MAGMNHPKGSPPRRDPSRSVVRGFAPMLIVIGILGFAIPQRRAITSGAPAYDVFHLIFGALHVGIGAGLILAGLKEASC